MAEGPGSIYVIGDVHGCAPELDALIKKLPLGPHSTVVFLGDYVDRGAHSKDVIEIILNLQSYCNVVTLMGNHEAMLLDFLEDRASAAAGLFIYNGGSSTLASYADDRGNFSIPGDHVHFAKSLKLFESIGDYFFVHAGVPNVALEEIDPARDKMKLLWVRDAFYKSKFQWSKLIIHGHTPVDEVEIVRSRINLDTGCVYGGKLTAMELPSGRIFSVLHDGETERVYLRDKTSARRSVRFEGTVPVYIRKGADTLECETVNYSEVGMLAMDLTPNRGLEFAQGDKVLGTIGPPGSDQVRFEGVVVRSEVRADGHAYYAIDIG